ncbi:MAG: hypothetical protein P8N76_17610 [Pirellulaceae bacterium]|nr:hypothetical protein [Pirellulaceae bacterium]
MFDKLHLMSTTHLIYITIGIAMTIWVARTLRIHGRIFFTKGCKGNDELADSLSHLFSVGFYLLHIGFVLLALKVGGTVLNSVGVIELLSTKIGLVLTVLGFSLFAHIAIFARIHGKPRDLNTSVDPITAEIANS